MMNKSKQILYFGLDPSRYETFFEIVHFPLIRTESLPFENVESYFTLPHTHVLFTSRTAVEYFFRYTSARDKTYLCVGEATAERLIDFGVYAAHVAEEACGEGVVAMLNRLSIDQILYPHSARARQLLPDYLKRRGIPFVLYDTFPCAVVLPDLSTFDQLVFTSPSTVTAFADLCPELPPKEKCITIGPITQNALNKLFDQAILQITNHTKRRSMTKKFNLPDLPYAYDALEPIISAEIMELHHKKHHAGYVNNLNAALEKYAEAEKKEDLSTMISLQPAIRFNGGGHINHSIFWTNLAPQDKGGGELPKGDFAGEMQKKFGSFDKFIEIFNGIAGPVQGSGWCWLGFCKTTHQLVIETCVNQDPLLGTKGVIPLLGIDVWEHAYYLQYKNVRPDYLKAIWKVVNWANVSQRYEQVKEACPTCK